MKGAPLIAHVPFDSPPSTGDTSSERIALAISKAGTLAIAGPSELRVYDLATGNNRYTLPHMAGPVQFSTDGSLLMALRLPGSGESAGPTVVETATGALLEVLSTSDVAIPSTIAAMDGPGGLLARRGLGGDQVTVWNIDGPLDFVTLDVAPWHGRRGLQSFLFSPGGEWLLTLGNNRALLWDTAQWKVRAALDENSATIRQAAFTTDSRRLLTLGSAGVQLWDCQSGSLLWTFAEPSGQPFIAASLDSTGQRLTAVSSDVWIWEATDR